MNDDEQIYSGQDNTTKENKEAEKEKKKKKKDKTEKKKKKDKKLEIEEIFGEEGADNIEIKDQSSVNNNGQDKLEEYKANDDIDSVILQAKNKIQEFSEGGSYYGGSKSNQAMSAYGQSQINQLSRTQNITGFQMDNQINKIKGNFVNEEQNKIYIAKRNQNQTIDAEEHKAASIDDSLSVGGQNKKIKELQEGLKFYGNSFHDEGESVSQISKGRTNIEIQFNDNQSRIEYDNISASGSVEKYGQQLKNYGASDKKGNNMINPNQRVLIDMDSQSIGSIKFDNNNNDRSNSLANLDAQIYDDGENQSYKPGQSKQFPKAKKYKKRKKRLDGAYSQEINQYDQGSENSQEKLEDYDDDQIANAYENGNFAWDGKSQSSFGKYSSQGPYGNPNLSQDGKRSIANVGLERGNSIGSASIGRVSQVNYDDQPSNILAKQGSSSLILEEEANPEYFGKKQKYNNISFPNRASDGSANRDTMFLDNTYTNVTAGDKLLNSDQSIIRFDKSSFNQNSNDKELMLKNAGRGAAFRKNGKFINPIKSNSNQIDSGSTPQKFFQKDQFEYELKQNDEDLSSYNTPDNLIKKSYKDSDQVQEDYLDLETGFKKRRPYTREDFKQMINKTYLEYYGKFKDQFNPDEYMQCVDNEELVKRFSAHLEQSEENMLTKSSLPWFDLGDIPSTHSFMRQESEQTYYIPQDNNPDLIFVKYSLFRPIYHLSDPKTRFESSNLPKQDVSFREFRDTINLCSLYMKNYRGKILMYELAGYAAMFAGLLMVVILSIVTSQGSSNWGTIVLFVLLYFIFVPIIYKVSKCFQCKYLRQAHFILAVVCRAENNRYYLKRGVQVRPGYLARWIEFQVMDIQGKNILEVLRENHQNVMQETQKYVEQDHQRFMNGVNRDITFQAIELRIQIEEATIGRPLTEDEKQEIIQSHLQKYANNNDEQRQKEKEEKKLEKQKNREQQNNGQNDQQESSSEVSSDWDDWQDPQYIEEQRQALIEFNKKQKEIKTAHQKKKKKKKSKKKRFRETGGDVLDQDVSEIGNQYVSKSEIDMGSAESLEDDPYEDAYKYSQKDKIIFENTQITYGKTNFNLGEDKDKNKVNYDMEFQKDQFKFNKQKNEQQDIQLEFVELPRMDSNESQEKQNTSQKKLIDQINSIGSIPKMESEEKLY